jgi:magnesium transporter
MQGLEKLVVSLSREHPDELAHAMECQSPAEVSRLMQALPKQVLDGVLDRLSPSSLGLALGHMAPEQISSLMGAVSLASIVRALHFLDAEKRNQTLELLPEDLRGRLRELLKYPPQTAGGTMDPQVVSIPSDFTVQQALSLLRSAPRESIHYLYVADRQQRLVGVLSMRDMLLAAPRAAVTSLMGREVLSVPASLDREEVAEKMRARRYFALPVTDEEGRLLGVVKHDDVLETVQEEAFEDLQRMVGAGPDESPRSPLLVKFRKRLPWLVVNLGTAFLAAAVVGLFEGILARMSVLAVLLPIVAGQAGNTGAQTLTVFIRGIALKEIEPGQRLRAVVLELLNGLAMGLAISLVAALAVHLWFGQGRLSIVMGLAMLFSMAIACVAGALIPLTVRALRRDPAQSSSIFMTTVTDVVGLGSFLGFARLLLF